MYLRIPAIVEGYHQTLPLHWQLQLREITRKFHPNSSLLVSLLVLYCYTHLAAFSRWDLTGVSVSLSDNTLARACCPILAITFKRVSKRATSLFASISISMYPSLPSESATRLYSFSSLTFSSIFKSFNKLAVAPF